MSRTNHAPKLAGFEHGLALLADPYRFIRRHCTALGSDVVQARVMLRPTLLMTGASAAEIFYDDSRFQRAGAAPEPLRATLFGKGTVQSLDGAAHRRRKAALLSLLSTESIARLVDLAADEWERAVGRWNVRGDVVLYPAAQEVLTRAACRWAGLALDESEVPERTRQIVALFDNAASGPWRHLQSRIARRRAETWLAKVVESVRAQRIAAPAGSALELISGLTEDQSAGSEPAGGQSARGAPLDPRIAAAEMLNLLRPTVAVSVYIALAAHALATHPKYARALDNDAALEAFVQEVRRHYPFFPAVMARVREGFVWHGLEFPRGCRVLLDLYGTDHDPRVWDKPDEFMPQRFLQRTPSPYEFIPQGGGAVASGHRCPGERVAVALTMQAVDLLANRLDYRMPPQDLSIDFRRLPALPHSGVVLRDVAFRLERT